MGLGLLWAILIVKKGFMNYILVIIVSYFAKIIRLLSKVLKKGSGTSLPGLIVETKLPFLVKYWNNKYEKVIFITGTNGKTTVRSLLNRIYLEAGNKTVTNIGGANIMRGIASSLLFDLDIFGKVKSKILILEVEEATLPKLTKYLKPDQLILTNIFRDQLDAYGEIDQTLDYFIESINNSNPQIIINADDDKLLNILDWNQKNVIGFSVDSKDKPGFEKSEVSSFQIEKLFTATNLEFSNFQTSFDIYSATDKLFEVNDFNLSGVFNVYNLLAVFSSLPQNFNKKHIQKSIAEFNPVFGRGEVISLKKNHRMFLVKNPAGFDQVLDLINTNCSSKKVNLVIAINDKIADGRDVSWLWDVNLEKFIRNQKLGNIITAGSRGLDMLVRMKYAGAEINQKNNFKNINELGSFLDSTQDDYIILATYTAMREIRDELSIYTNLPDITDKGN